MYFRELFQDMTPLYLVLAALMTVSFIIQLFYYLIVFRKITAYKSVAVSDQNHGVSVIICARNEADNLENHMPAFLEQSYEPYEVIVVNDCSTDHTDEVLMNLKIRYPQLVVTTIQPDRKFTHGKKLAVTVGIKAAKYEHLLFSDADCEPATPQWVEKMSRHFNGETEIILGIGKYRQLPGLLNLVVRFETLFTAMQYISFALRGQPFMGVGRNMAYTRALFFRNKGFASHLKLQSGDDDLFIRDTATRFNTRIEIEPEAYTISVPPRTPREWIQQKRRHITTGKYYRISTKIRLGTEYVSRVLFYISVIVLMLDHNWLPLAGSILFLLTLVKLIRFKLVMNRLSEKDLLLPSLLIEPILPLVLGLMQIGNFFRREEPKWN